MASESDSHSNDTQESLKSSVRRLQSEMRDLSESAQQLLTEKLVLESEVAQVKKRASRLEEEIRNLRSPPMIVGYIQAVSYTDLTLPTILLVNI